MSLFSHYQSTGLAFPCDASGHLQPNFKREWVAALGRGSFAFANEQNLRTWQREWSTLDDEAKKSAMSQLMRRVRNRHTDDDEYTPNPLAMPSFLTSLEPYLSVFDANDALHWTEAFTLSTMAERDSSNYEVSTLTFAAHLLHWLLEKQPSALPSAVEMLQSWGAFASTKLYKNEDRVHWPAALERLAHALPNNALEQVCALASARAGYPGLLVQLLSRKGTDVQTLFQRAVDVGEPVQVLSLLSMVVGEGKGEDFATHVQELGQHLLGLYNQQRRPAARVHASAREEVQVGGFLQALVKLGIACSKETLEFMTTQAPYLNETRYFDCLAQFSPSWSAKENEAFFSAWNREGGYFNRGNLFNASQNHRNLQAARAVFSAMAVLPDYWTEWLHIEFGSSLKDFGPAIFPERATDALDLALHRWAHEGLPRVYQHWIRGIPANAQLLADPVLGATARKYTQAASDTFLFDSTMAWLKAPETNYDVRNKHFALACLAWEQHGVNIDEALQRVMDSDHEGDYRALIMEAILPGGRNRWEALQCVMDSFSDGSDSNSDSPRGTHPLSKPLVSDFVRNCIHERLHPTQAMVLTLEETGRLFA